MLHSNVADSLELNVNVTDGPVEAPLAGPPVIVVFGATVSTVNVREAGDASTLPAASTARTSSVWAPSPCAGTV